MSLETKEIKKSKKSKLKPVASVLLLSLIGGGVAGGYYLNNNPEMKDKIYSQAYNVKNQVFDLFNNKNENKSSIDTRENKEVNTVSNNVETLSNLEIDEKTFLDIEKGISNDNSLSLSAAKETPNPLVNKSEKDLLSEEEAILKQQEEEMKRFEALQAEFKRKQEADKARLEAIKQEKDRKQRELVEKKAIEFKNQELTKINKQLEESKAEITKFINMRNQEIASLENQIKTNEDEFKKAQDKHNSIKEAVSVQLQKIEQISKDNEEKFKQAQLSFAENEAKIKQFLSEQKVPLTEKYNDDILLVENQAKSLQDRIDYFNSLSTEQLINEANLASELPKNTNTTRIIANSNSLEITADKANMAKTQGGDIKPNDKQSQPAKQTQAKEDKKYKANSAWLKQTINRDRGNTNNLDSWTEKQ